MQDGIIAGNGSSRYLKTVAAALSLYPSYEDFITALIAGTFPIDLNGINEAGWSRQGTPLNKGTLLSDTTETKIWGSAGNHTVDQALGQILGSIGYSLVKEYTSPGSFTHTFDRKYTDIFVIVVGAGGGGGVGEIRKTNEYYNEWEGRGGGGGGAGEVVVAYFLDSTKISNKNIVIGSGGSGGASVSPNGADSDIDGRKGMSGGSSSAFGITAAGGSPGDSFDAGKAGGVASNITSGPGFGGRGHVNDTVSEQGEDGSLIMTFGIRAPGGGGGGGNSKGSSTGNSDGTGAPGGSSGGGRGGNGATSSANGTNGADGSRGGGGGGAGGGCNFLYQQKSSGNGGRGGHGYVAIYGRGAF
nr:MAG TPA: hypothetical protein [Caudoviricetes sp.]